MNQVKRLLFQVDTVRCHVCGRGFMVEPNPNRVEPALPVLTTYEEFNTCPACRDKSMRDLTEAIMSLDFKEFFSRAFENNDVDALFIRLRS